MRTLDKTKKSNIKCEHCKHYYFDGMSGWCKLLNTAKHYWNRCKNFEWGNDND